MTGPTIPPAALAAAVVPGTAIGGEQRLGLSFKNSFRVASVVERLTSRVLQPQPFTQNHAVEFFNLLISLARGIDYAVSNNEVPTKAKDLPTLIKKVASRFQVCQRKVDLSLQAAAVVLMISVKNACKIGWFSAEENKEILALANEVCCNYLLIGNDFSGPGDTNPVPNNLVSTILTVMARFYPQMKMGQILASLDVKPGYGAFMVDFHISKSTEYAPLEKVMLFVAQTDNIETSACIISPQQANFIINGKGIDRRTSVYMVSASTLTGSVKDAGPQLPTNVTAMLKYGTNLLQVVGQFNGHYIVIVAFMSRAPSLEIPVLQDYLQSGITIQDSDSDIIEGPSRISLNCPISYTRIRIPVKGHSCKHLQCFDCSNFININSRRPSWRCPHCNQHVCYTDIRVDQNMVKVLREVGENVTDVIISADGSWRAVFESDDNVDTHNNTSSRNKERSEQQEYTDHMNIDPVVLDLTTNDEEMDAASTDETEDTKPPLLASLQSQTVGLHSNGFAISGVLDARNDGGISEPTFVNRMTSPVLTDAISPALDRGAEDCGHVDLNSVMLGQYSAPGNLQLQQSQFVDSGVNNEYGRFSSLNRNVHRTPIAVQALPAPSQTPAPQQRLGSNFNSSNQNGSSLSSQAALSVANGYRPNMADIERQLQQIQQQQRQQLQKQQEQLRISRAHLNSLVRPPSFQLQHHSAAQVVGPPASGTHPDPNQVSSGLPTENQNLHQQQAVNLMMPQSRSQSPSSIQLSSPLSRSSIQQGGAQPGVGHTAGTITSQHARVMLGAQRAAGKANQFTRQAPTVPVQVSTSRTGTSYQVRTDGARVPVGEQRVNIGGGVQGVRADNTVDLTSEQNWQPTGRMRGSLSGRAYSAALSQFMIQPTQQAQPARTQPNQTSPLPSIPPGLQAYIGNRSARVPPNTEPGNVNAGSGVL